MREAPVSEGKVIEFSDVSMVFGDVPAVDGLTARVDPGRVTAFLGPNGAGKTTTLRVLLGDLRPSDGRATVGGTEYRRIPRPAASIGAVMSLAALEKSRRKTTSKHLERAARRIGVGSGRVREVLTIVGLTEMTDMRISNLSLGMKHRLAVAEALLGDPGVLVFDEPANGLDPEGIRWIRLLMRRFADEGRTVLMSSHVLSEVEQVADALLVLSQGELLFEGPIELLSDAEGGLVTVDADDRDALRTELDEARIDYRVLRSGITIDGTSTAKVGALAQSAGIALTTLTQRGPSLEDIYLQIIDGTWTPPARTAALQPSAGAEDDSAADAPEGEDDEPASGVSADATGHENDGDTDATVEAADDDGSASTSYATEDADDEPSAGDDEAASGATADEDDESDDADEDSTDASGDGTDDEPADAEESASDDSPDAPDSDDAETGASADSRATTGLPGLTGLAGLARGLHSDDIDGDDDEIPDDAVSPALRAAFERADELERDADDIESDVTRAEATVADDDWEAQLRAMFDDEPEPAGTDRAPNDPFPTANFDAPENR